VSEGQAFLMVEVKVMVPLPADWDGTWPEERCAEKAAEIHNEIGRRHGVSTKFDWWVQS